MGKFLQISLITSLFFLANAFKASAQLTIDGAIVSVENSGLVYANTDIINRDADVTNKGTIVLTGDWENSSVNSANRVFNTASDGTVEMAGTNQILGGTTPTEFQKLDFTGDGVKTMEVNQSVTRELALNKSELATETYIMHVTNSSPFGISRFSGFVSTKLGGGLRRDMGLNLSYLYPLGARNGNNVIYRPLDIIPNATTNHSYTASFLAYNPNTDGIDTRAVEGEISDANEQYYHRIIRNVGSSPATIAVSFKSIVDGDFNALANWKGARSKLVNLPQVDPEEGTYPDGLNKKVILQNWNDFTDEPYVLANLAIPPRVIVVGKVVTPDGDGINDYLDITGLDKDDEVMLFNRWGTVIYKSMNYGKEGQPGWTGDNAVAGTYFYTIIPKDKKMSPLKGYITLIK